MSGRRWTLVLLVACLVPVLAACTIMKEVQIVPQSHFTPPNSNVEPIGLVTGEASGGSFGYPDMSAQIIERAYADALRKKGGDLLINVKLQRNVTTILIFPFYTTSVRVEGTAARMKVGAQRLSELRREQIEELARTAPAPSYR